MKNIGVRLAVQNFPSIVPIALRQVEAGDMDVELVVGGNSLGERKSILARALFDPTLQGGETSASQHAGRIDRGDRSFVALPVFILREFQGRGLFVRKGSHIRTGADLNGARIGMYAFQATGTLWYRHFLEYIGVDLGTVTWVTGGIDEPGPSKYAEKLPPEVRSAPADRSLSQMLIDGEIDALYCDPKSARYHPTDGPIIRLFGDIKAVEQQYYRDTGVFPIQHIVAVRSEVWKAYPQVVHRVTEAFVAADEVFRVSQLTHGGGSPWSLFEIEDTAAIMRDRLRTHGIEGNEKALDRLFHYAHMAGVTSRKVTIEEYFEEYLSTRRE